MDDKRKGMSRVWFMLGVPPILFFIIIVIVSVYFGVITHGDAQAIAKNTSSATPHILLIVQVLLLLFLLRTIRADKLTFRDIGWQLPAGQSWWQEILIGVLDPTPALGEPLRSAPRAAKAHRSASFFCDHATLQNH